MDSFRRLSAVFRSSPTWTSWTARPSAASSPSPRTPSSGKKPFRVFGEPEELERGGEVVYFCVIGPEGLIRETAREAERVPGVSLTAYPDAYEPWVWYLEIFPETASKRHAVEFLRSWTGADFVVAFGDNRNDIPMFEAADFAVAVSSASEEVKAEADAETDSVTEFIERLAGLA